MFTHQGALKFTRNEFHFMSGSKNVIIVQTSPPLTAETHAAA